MTKDNCCSEKKYLCPVCEKEEHEKAWKNLHDKISSKIQNIIAKEVIGREHHPSNLHYSRVQEIVTDVLVQSAVHQQTFNRMVIYKQKYFDQEMIDDLKIQYDWYVDQAVERINEKAPNSENDPEFDGDYTPQKSELN
jgi:hypothetical protein|tara:strand:- start:778 stop:1191 length:414 start_codon:yes stop_codon:yes gene_type:complete